ncbi:hypothetical protein FOZ60_013764 [Perkinsus olseni]|uniref:Uncharacterized protein n=1 Tax=Perkinsus olseni TaxID=32597 RepID=A0A7J6N8Z9_PEROL|nr:hypothetical protein FOZ60_013764 [Perkinsus olseni]
MDTLPPTQTLFDGVQSPDSESPRTVTSGNQMRMDAPSSYIANIPLDGATASLAITKSGEYAVRDYFHDWKHWCNNGHYRL